MYQVASPAIIICKRLFITRPCIIFTVDDSAQAPAITALAKEAGLEKIIFTWQSDTWGDGLQSSTADYLQRSGISVYQEVRYDSLKSSFSNETALLDRYVTELTEQGTALEKIGIIIITCEQVATFLAEAANHSQLREVIWIGSDGTALSESLAQNDGAANFASGVKMLHPMTRLPAISDETNRMRVSNRIMQIHGRDTDHYSYIVYDAVWAFALAIDQYGYDPVAVKSALPDIVDKWSSLYGASGHIVLNEYGDRSFADFDYWYLNAYQEWESPGYYDGSENSVVWMRNVY